MPPDQNIRQQQQYGDAVRVTNTQLEATVKLMQSFGKEGSKSLKNNIKFLSDFTDEFDDGIGKIRDMSKAISSLHIKDHLSTEHASKLNSKLGELQKTLVKLKSQKPEGDQWKVQKEAVKKLKKEIGGVQKEIDKSTAQGKSFVDTMEDAGPSFMKNWAKFSKAQGKSTTGIQQYGFMLDNAGVSLSELPGGLKLAGKAAKGLGSMLGGVSEIFAGWSGALLMGVKALWNIGMAADQFVKDANKAFAYVRGPDIMNSDIKGQFKEFNDQIYNMSENLRTGTNVEQIKGLMEAIHMAGQNITDLNGNLMTYRDSIYVASKASKTLGLVLPQVGDMMGKMMTDLRMDLDSVDKSFVQVAFDAKKSGLSTDRFWSSVQNASASMALYGNTISSASKTVSRFNEDMIGGADDAAAATENMYDVFKSGSLTANASIIQFAKKSGVNINKMFKDMSIAQTEKAGDLKSEINFLAGKSDKSDEDVKELKKLRSQLYDAESKAERFNKISSSNAVTQSTEMAALAKNAPEILMGIIKKVGRVGDLGQLSGQKLLVVMEALNSQFGVNSKTVKMLVEGSRRSNLELVSLLDASKKYFGDNKKLFKENKEGIAKAVEDVGSTQGDAQIKASEKLTELMSNLGMDPEMAKLWGGIIRADENNAEKIAGLIKVGDVDSLKELDKLVSSSKLAHAYSVNQFKDASKTEEEIAKASEDTFKGIVDQTLSFNEMKDIAKDDIKWRASSLGVAQAMNQGVSNIFNFLVRNNKKYMSAGQKKSQRRLISDVEKDPELKALLKMKGKGNKARITPESQMALTEKISSRIAKLNQAIVDNTTVDKALSGAMDKKGAKEMSASLKTSSGKASGDAKMALGVQAGVMSKFGDVVSSFAGGDSGEAIDQFKNFFSTFDIPEKEQDNIIAKLEHIKASNESDSKKKERAEALSKKVLESMQKVNDANLKENEAQKAVQEKMNGHLGTIEKSNLLLAKYTKYKIKEDPKIFEEMKDEVNARITGGENPMSVAKSMGMGIPEMNKMFGIENNVPTKYNSKSYLGISASNEEAKKLKEDATLKEPVKVTSPGAVILHPGESIMPKNYMNFKTMSAESGPKGAQGVGGGRNDIQINVTATEKDLSEKIANKVREVLYSNQLNGMG